MIKTFVPNAANLDAPTIAKLRNAIALYPSSSINVSEILSLRAVMPAYVSIIESLKRDFIKKVNSVRTRRSI